MKPKQPKPLWKSLLDLINPESEINMESSGLVGGSIAFALACAALAAFIITSPHP